MLRHGRPLNHTPSFSLRGSAATVAGSTTASRWGMRRRRRYGGIRLLGNTGPAPVHPLRHQRYYCCCCCSGGSWECRWCRGRCSSSSSSRNSSRDILGTRRSMHRHGASPAATSAHDYICYRGSYITVVLDGYQKCLVQLVDHQVVHCSSIHNITATVVVGSTTNATYLRQLRASLLIVRLIQLRVQWRIILHPCTPRHPRSCGGRHYVARHRACSHPCCFGLLLC
mmetsp:Transcript_28962/g.48637  ORF Transcript_28962/g.48637 Transcript_28962/m.48637 type:complete len:226 (-) Transcript_28962:48-725(-)